MLGAYACGRPENFEDTYLGRGGACFVRADAGAWWAHKRCFKHVGWMCGCGGRVLARIGGYEYAILYDVSNDGKSFCLWVNFTIRVPL